MKEDDEEMEAALEQARKETLEYLLKDYTAQRH